ncbi:MAG: alpha/beta fold hydrolase, partial [Myxococcales bacterium]|nr:alpha/beta fold hydrolase [Myxococcales bacterium]
MSDTGRIWSGLRKLAGRLGQGLPPVGKTPHDVVWTENKWRLLRFRPRADAPRRYRTPILLVPSLINRWYILDLQPGRSFAEWMVAQGHDVYIIDWGTPGAEDRYLTFDDVCDRYVGRALRQVARRGPDGVAHVLGYCLGGTLAAIHAAARPERVASLVALAAPVDFHDDGLLSRWTRVPTFDVGAIVDAFGNVPWPLMQASFQLLKPTLNLAKLVTLVDRSWDDEFLDGFLATERWGNDNVSFPGECYRRYIEALYRDNALVRGDFTLSGRPARLDAIDCPVLAVTFEHDHIVPPRSAAVLLDHVASPDKDQLHLRGGHVGAVVSRKAAQTLWPALSRWWAARDTDAARGL